MKRHLIDEGAGGPIKLLIILLTGVFAFTSFAFAESYPHMPKDKIAEIAPICPETNVTNDIVQCTTCHSLDRWKLREPYPNDILRHPEWIIYQEDEKRGYYLLTSVNAASVKEFLDYIDFHNKKYVKKISHITIEIQSYGGGLADSWRTIGLLQQWEKAGGIVETQIHGIAFSAGFLIFISGTKGHRFVSPTAELMWHELQAWKQTGIETPSSMEDEADIYRHLQNTATNWIISRSKITKEELDEKVRNKEFWLNGAEAVECGFADGLIK
jgi:ATP-dependent protease ClpP protease subunit